MEKILAKLSPKAQSLGSKPSINQEILTKLSEQQLLLEKQKSLLAGSNAVPGARLESDRSSSTSPPTSATDSVQVPVSVGAVQSTEVAELLRLKQELFAANSKIAFQEEELAQTRVMKHTLDQALGPPSETDFGNREVTEQTICHLQNAFKASNRPLNQIQDAWNGQDDSQSDLSDPLSAGGYSRARGFWVPPTQQALGSNANPPAAEKGYGESFPLPTGQSSNKFWGNAGANAIPGGVPFQSHRALPGPSLGTCGYDARFPGDLTPYLQGPGLGARRPIAQANRGGSCFPAQNSPWAAFGAVPSGNPVPRSPGSRPSSTYQQVGLYPIPPFPPGPVGTPLSPTASEFTSSGSNVLPWGASSVSWNPRASFLVCAHICRLVGVAAKRTFHPLSLSITAGCSIKTFRVTGNTSWTRSFVATTNRRQFSCSRNSKLGPLNKNTTLSRPLHIRLTPSWSTVSAIS